MRAHSVPFTAGHSGGQHRRRLGVLTDAGLNTENNIGIDSFNLKLFFSTLTFIIFLPPCTQCLFAYTLNILHIIYIYIYIYNTIPASPLSHLSLKMLQKCCNFHERASSRPSWVSSPQAAPFLLRPYKIRGGLTCILFIFLYLLSNGRNGHEGQ